MIDGDVKNVLQNIRKNIVKKNRDKQNYYYKQYREKNKAKLKESWKKYSEENKEKRNVYNKERINNLTYLFNKNGYLNVIQEFYVYMNHHKKSRNRIALDFTFDEFYRFHKTIDICLKRSLGTKYGKGTITKEDVLFQCGEILTERDKQMLSIFRKYFENENDRYLKIEKFINKMKEAGLLVE